MFKTLCLSLALTLSAATGALADPGDAHDNDTGLGHVLHQGLGLGHHKGGGETQVPELDPSAAGGALILLIGGTLVLLERRR